MYFKYGENDVRRDVTCVNYKWTKGSDPELAGISKWYFGKYRFEWMNAQPYTGGNDDGIKPVVMRYADILLMAAEIENELNGPANAKQYLLPVRARACGEDAAEAYVNGLNTQEAFFNAIVEERALEFCGEFLRKGDLIRWNMLKDKLDEAIEDMLDLRDLDGAYANLTGDALYRIAEDEMSLEYVFPVVGGDVPSGYETSAAYVTKYDDSKSSGFYTDRIYGIYYNNPNEYMYWPIFYDTITNSQGNIKNDYHYDNPS